MNTKDECKTKLPKQALKLSVIIPVYNLEKFIGACLEGILHQDVSFNYEVIVADDASSDGSKAIIAAFHKQYPDIVKPIYQEKNVGLVQNLRNLLDIANGQYIAYLDGDDIALPNKLSRQVSYLDANPECAICYHESEVFDSGSGNVISLYTRDNYNFQHIPTKANLSHLIKYGTFLQASSVMFRHHPNLSKVIDPQSPVIVDYPMHIANAFFINGTIDFIDDVLGRYRVHQESFGAQTARSVSRREQVLSDLCAICDRSKQFGVTESDIAMGKIHFTFAAALYFLRMNEYELFKKYIESASVSMCFFNDKHQYAYEHRADPQKLKKHLFN